MVRQRLVSTDLSFSKITLEGILRLAGSEQRRKRGRGFLLLWSGGEIMEDSGDGECKLLQRGISDVVSKLQ